MNRRKNIVVLTGAGVSVESGLRAYRGEGGIWTEMGDSPLRKEHLESDPKGVGAFFRDLLAKSDAAEPNTAHAALARLEAEWRGDFLLVTQNVDSLHERAGSKRVLHIHGRLGESSCLACGSGGLYGDRCLACGSTRLRPDVVMFGERPKHMEEVYAAVDRCDIFVAVGTSCTVRPASLLPRMAWTNCERGPRKAEGAGRAFVVEVNTEPSGVLAFSEVLRGKATEAVPRLVERLID